MATIQLGVEYLAKYPFLAEAGEYVRRLRLDVEELAQPEYVPILQRARRRVLDAIRQARVSEEPLDPDIELLSFPLALLLARATGLEYLASRFSLAEAMRIERLLERERPGLIADLFQKALGIEATHVSLVVGGQTFEFKIPVREYLRRAVHFHKPEWKLVNRLVERGYVYLKTHDLIRLIRAEIGHVILQRLRSLSVPRLPSALQVVVDELRLLAPPPRVFEDYTHLRPGSYPPCVEHALEILRRGENVPHYGRFLLASFLLSIGRTTDEVVAEFQRSPDFKETIARYHVEHIAGLRGGRIRYHVPSCQTLQAHSFCFKTEACDDIRNPLQFGRRLPIFRGERKRTSDARARRPSPAAT